MTEKNVVTAIRDALHDEMADDDRIVLLGEDDGEIGGSEYLATVHQLEAGVPPRVNLEGEKRLADFVRAAVRGGRVKSAHDISGGGVAVALAECCFRGRAGQEIGAMVLAKLKADAEAKCNFLQGQINNLLAIEFKPEVEKK